MLVRVLLAGYGPRSPLGHPKSESGVTARSRVLPGVVCPVPALYKGLTPEAAVEAEIAQGTNAIEACKRVGVEFVVASTLEVSVGRTKWRKGCEVGTSCLGPGVARRAAARRCACARCQYFHTSPYFSVYRRRRERSLCGWCTVTT